MNIRQIRNATLRIDYAGVRFLIDPYLAEKEAYPGFRPGTDVRNPRVALETSMEQILDTDAVIVTHTHSDHWDEAATRLIPKHLPVYAPHDSDAGLIRSQSFSRVEVLGERTSFGGVALHKAVGQHGSDRAIELAGDRLGQVCGIVLQHAREKTLYVAGDSVWNAMVASNIAAFTPRVIILNAGDAQLPNLGSLIMSEEDVLKVHQAAPDATLIASHMEALDHCTLTRHALHMFRLRMIVIFARPAMVRQLPAIWVGMTWCTA